MDVWNKFVKPIPVSAPPWFLIFAVKVVLAFNIAGVGLWRTLMVVKSGPDTGAPDTATFRQVLQLSLSFTTPSVILPDIDVLLSAQNLTERVPAAPVNVYEAVAVAYAPPARGPIETGAEAVRGLTGPAPFGPVATCMELEKPDTVPDVPMFLIKEEKEMGVFNVAEAGLGITGSAVKLGPEEPTVSEPARGLTVAQ